MHIYLQLTKQMRFRSKNKKILWRNESVLVEYSDGVCDTTWARVTEDVHCACACLPLACPGLARVDNDTCTCTCAEETRVNTTCPESQSFSVHSCGCECEAVEADCPGPLFWSPDLCSCSIAFTCSMPIEV